MTGNRARPPLIRSTREIAARRARWRGLRREQYESDNPQRPEQRADAQPERESD